MSQRVVVVGGGFGGLLAARKLRRADVALTLIDRQNFFLFQPLVYQVATGALSSAEVATPLRQLLRRQRNATVLLGEVTGFDLVAREVTIADLPTGDGERRIGYDTLVVAGGSRYSYFGHDDWAPHAPELKSLDGAIELRNRILSAFEAAELEPDADARSAWLTFVVVGAGPTGVEMAGQIAELGARVAPPRVPQRRHAGRCACCSSRPAIACSRAIRARSPARPTRSCARSVSRRWSRRPSSGSARTRSSWRRATARARRVPARTAVWAAGVQASPLAGLLAAAAGGETDRAGRITVERDLTLAGHPSLRDR